ncbi:MAG TPA: MauE/DoxX family redox-associated membrane protein [Phycisphaerales bacterium]|nr:MauE/DoxX family redox-associated membrane protein [Phycisphaerales bacterium]
MPTTLAIEGMHCESCVKKLTRALLTVPGVTDAAVTLEPPRATVDADGPVRPEALAAAAQRAGGYRIRVLDEPALAAPVVVHEGAAERPTSLYPLFLIVAYIAGAAAVVQAVRTGGSWHGFLNDFMAGFFLVFSFFKLLDLRGFAGAYRTYDLVATAVPAWGLVYPFVELALGVAYLAGWRPGLSNAVTLALMLVGAAGVLRALLRKDRLRCACLGTVLNLPMTTVTLVEDLGMAAMAAWMLFAR